MADLKKKSVRGGMVTMVSQAASIGIQLTSTVVLARLLSPEDYGVIAMVMAVTSIAGLFRDLGLSSAAIQKKNLTRAQQSNLFWLNVVMGSLLTTIVAVGSPLVAWFYGKPELTAVTLALSASFLIGSIGTQHGAMLVRNMQFGRKAAATITGSVVSLVIAITLALNGYSYWALVWGSLAGSAATTLLLFSLSPFWPQLPSKGAGIRGMLKFGANITAFDFVNYFARNLDNILIGRYWGAGSLGMYSRAYQLLMFPINTIRGPIQAVAFPAMSKFDPDSPKFRQYYLSVVRLVATASMPLIAWIFVSSEEIVMLGLGPTWSHVIPIFNWLAVAAFIQPVSSLRGLLLLSSGQGRRYLEAGLITSVVVSAGFAIGVCWGAVGVAVSYAISICLLAQPMHNYCCRGTAVKNGDLLGASWRPMATSLTGVLVVLMVDQYIKGCADPVELTIKAFLIGVIAAPVMIRELRRFYKPNFN